MAARVAVALERFVDELELDGLTYYYEGEPDSPMRRLVTNLIVGNSLLTAAGFPMCGEADLKTCIAMLIEDRLDIGGSFAEFHPIDFREGFVLVGHDGPHHLNIADGKARSAQSGEVSRQARLGRQCGVQDQRGAHHDARHRDHLWRAVQVRHRRRAECSRSDYRPPAIPIPAASSGPMSGRS